MIAKIWRVLTQILFYRNDLNEAMKPFFENLKNENINDENIFHFLKHFQNINLKFYIKMELLKKINLIPSFQIIKKKIKPQQKK